MTTREAAEALGWTERQVLRALHLGTLKGLKPGVHRWRVFRASVDEVLRYAAGGAGGLPPQLKDKLKRFSRLTAELTALARELEDDLDPDGHAGGGHADG
jgi:excisionase family DNA binding protein